MGGRKERSKSKRHAGALVTGQGAISPNTLTHLLLLGVSAPSTARPAAPPRLGCMRARASVLHFYCITCCVLSHSLNHPLTLTHIHIQLNAAARGKKTFPVRASPSRITSTRKTHSELRPIRTHRNCSLLQPSTHPPSGVPSVSFALR